MKLRIAAVASVSLLALAGCGSSDFQQDLEDTLDNDISQEQFEGLCEFYDEVGWDEVSDTVQAIYAENGSHDWDDDEAQEVMEDRCD